MSRLPKQLIWSALLWLIVCTSIWAEDDLTITVVPEAPTTNSNISIVVADLNRLEGGTLLFLNLLRPSEYIVEGNIVKLFINASRFRNFHVGVADPSATNITTSINFALGILPAGSYEVELYLVITSTVPKSDPQLIQKSLFSISSIHSIPSLSGIGLILLSLTIAIFGGQHRLRKKQ